MKKKYLELAEEWFVTISLLLSTGGPITVLRSVGGNGQETNDPLLQLVFFGIYLVSSLLIALRWQQVVPELMKRDKLVWLLLLFVVASTLWSAAPSTTLRRSLALLGTTLFAIYVSTRYHLKQQIKLVSRAFGLAVGMSFIFGALLPKYGIMQAIHVGAWRGIYTHKNTLGGVMATIAVLFLVLLTDSSYRRKKTTWAGLIFSVLLLLLSTSKTALVLFITLASVLPLYRALRWRYHLMIPVLISVFLVTGGIATLVLENSKTIFALLGKDSTLTGRTQIWSYVWDMIEQRPWLGYGYSGFWGNWDSPGAYVWDAFGWKAPHSHNGLLELLVAIGLIGTALFFVGFIMAFFRSIALLRCTREPEYLWLAMYLSYLFLGNIAEKNILDYNNIYWILYVIVTFAVIDPSTAVVTNRYRVKNPYKDFNYQSQMTLK